MNAHSTPAKKIRAYMALPVKKIKEFRINKYLFIFFVAFSLVFIASVMGYAIWHFVIE